MSLSVSRLRAGELVAALSALALASLMAAAPWFARAGHRQTGWHALPGLRWLLVAAVAGGLAIAIAQAACSAPAVPATLDAVQTVLAATAAAALAIRLATTSARPLTGAWLGLAAAVALAGGAFVSLRQEDGWEPGPERPIEVVTLEDDGRSP
ncbi:MAG TPA: hypothetical protein VKV27_14550 [Solirubrobacteraceae bacterium]|nr:hypothetical protein [Solirubrobacteraceae bacterium]